MAAAKGVASRYLAVCDVLGFTNSVASQPVWELADRYRRLVDETKRSCAGLIPDADPTLGRQPSWAREKLGHAVFSDTLFLWSAPMHRRTDNKSRSLNWMKGFYFFTTIKNLIAYALLQDLPLRGGIAFGESLIDPARHIYIGQPIIEAYRTEQRQEWMGVALHPSCLDAPNPDWYDPNDDSVLVEYPVPTKAEVRGPALQWSIDWAAHPPMDWPEVSAQAAGRDVESALYAQVDRWTGTPWEAKWRNTLDFYLARAGGNAR